MKIRFLLICTLTLMQSIGLSNADSCGDCKIDFNVNRPQTCDKMITTHNLVSFVQESLNEFGYNPGSADGKIGPRTLEAVMKYRSKLMGENPNKGYDIIFVEHILIGKERGNIARRITNECRSSVEENSFIDSCVAASKNMNNRRRFFNFSEKKRNNIARKVEACKSRYPESTFN